MFRSVQTLFVASALTGSALAQSLPHQVAFDDLGVTSAQPHLLEGSNYTWPASVPAAVTDRTIAFGPAVSVGYGGAQPTASYQAQVLLSTDGDARQCQILVDDVAIGGVETVPANTERTVTVAIPGSAFADDGKFILSVLKTGTAPNAAVSRVTVFSTANDALSATQLDLNMPEVRYTPQPVPDADGTKWTLSLNGIWKFLETAPANFTNLDDSTWAEIEVPGQWRNQGWNLPANQAVGYHRNFTLPAEWAGRRIRLRFDGVYSDCEIFLNGKSIGTHLGGFTPFELDVTDEVKPGNNTLGLRVTSESMADKSSGASAYACHPLGGISRDVTLFSVPETHIAEWWIRTDMDTQFVNANLLLDLEVEGTTADAQISLTAPDGSSVFSTTETLNPGTEALSFAVNQPLWWTPETPNLYTLEIDLDGTKIRHPVGFREVAMNGREVLVNGRPVRMRGINRHEANPLRGRSLLPGQWEQDLLLFRDANANLLRTCHYPPALHLADAADRHGMWLEIEAPYCFDGTSGDRNFRPLAVSQFTEMAKAWRNHPSVLFWSVGNESTWGTNFVLGARVLQELDPTRPRTFNFVNTGPQTVDEASTHIAGYHYPGFGGAPSAKNYAARPSYFGEYSHLNAYNRRELMTDPGLRNRWGQPFSEMWETMWTEPAVLGGSIWAGIDDTFFLDADGTVGYGGWGPIDPWRRVKPEWLNMRRIYSPVHVIAENQPSVTASALVVPVENRGDFVNFNQLSFQWKHGDQSGAISPDIAARQAGELRIEPPLGIAFGVPVDLTVTDATGREIDRFSFPTGAAPRREFSNGNPSLETSAASYSITQGNAVYQFNRTTGALSWSVNGQSVPVVGPHLILTPRNTEGVTQMTGNTLHYQPLVTVAGGAVIGTVTASTASDGSVTVTVPVNYTQANGNFVFRFEANQPVRLSYQFTVKTAFSPRQTGVAMDFPDSFSELSWQRQGQWTSFPDDHIGRLDGVAQLTSANGKTATEIGPRTEPGTPWSQDNTPFGSNDFRSTKEDISWSSLSNGLSSVQVFATGQGTHIQAIEINNRVMFSLLNYSNAGSERFLQRLASRHYREHAVGSTIRGTVYFQADDAAGSRHTTSINSAIPLIGEHLRNGNFEKSTVASPTLVSGGKIVHWQTWSGQATATDDTGVYGSARSGNQSLYLQEGGAVVNITDQIAAAGQEYEFGFTDLLGAGEASGILELVYQDGANFVAVAGSSLTSPSTDPACMAYRKSFVIPTDSPAIGKRVGLGLRTTGSFPELDSVFLDLKRTLSGFALFAEERGFSASQLNAASQSDRDVDGLSLGVEYLTGRGGTDSSPIQADGIGQFELVLRDTEPDDALQGQVEVSDDLQTWRVTGFTLTPSADQSGIPAGFTRQTIALPANTARMFVRLRASVNP